MKRRASLAILIFLGLFLIVFHEEIIDFLEDLFSSDPRPVIARLENFNGEVNFKLPKTLVYKRVKKDLGLRNQDTVVTDADSKAIIAFESGFRLEVDENSIVVIEQPQVGEDGTIRVTFLRGDFRVLSQGTQGQLVVSKDNIIQDAAGRPAPKIPIQVSLKAPPKPPEPPPPQTIKTDTIDEIRKTVEKPKVVAKAKPRETLPDDYIASIIRKQTPFLNRCYAEHLRINPNARGRINLSFSISPAGIVTSVRLLGSTLRDPKLEACTMAVIERSRFKKFDGDPIIVNYPINFE